MIHVAVLAPVYARLVVSGEKTCESRFTKTLREPFGRVAAGETVYIKRRSGPVVASARVEQVLCVSGLSPAAVEDLLERHAAEICAEPSYVDLVRDRRYATLVWLREVRPMDLRPDLSAWVPRGSRSAWHCLPDQAAGVFVEKGTLYDGVRAIA